MVTSLLAVLLAGPASAHPGHLGHGDAVGFVHGFMHPLGGLDHVLAMLAVGLLACLLRGRALWLVPSAFVGMMAAGGLLAAYGLAVPQIELGIALSIVVIGALVALGRDLPVAVATAVVAAFAIFHGAAHAAEMPAAVSGLSYGLGFMLATAALHGAGILAGFGFASAGRVFGPRLMRAGGALIAAAGVAVLGGSL
tara:strand:- start:153 stop:740 length:588 start_codon:yes stop_codon:yes gene_type:complete